MWRVGLSGTVYGTRTPLELPSPQFLTASLTGTSPISEVTPPHRALLVLTLQEHLPTCMRARRHLLYIIVMAEASISDTSLSHHNHLLHDDNHLLLSRRGARRSSVMLCSAF